MSSRRKRGDPILNEAAPFPLKLGTTVEVEYDGSPWSAKIHRIAVDQKTCTVKYEDGSIEPSVSPSRINNDQGQVVEQPIPLTLQKIEEGDGGSDTEEMPDDNEEEEEEVPAAIESPPTLTLEPAIPTVELRTKKQVTALNKAFAKLMKERLKLMKHKCKWCCHLRGLSPNPKLSPNP